MPAQATTITTDATTETATSWAGQVSFGASIDVATVKFMVCVVPAYPIESLANKVKLWCPSLNPVKVLFPSIVALKTKEKKQAAIPTAFS